MERTTPSGQDQQVPDLARHRVDVQTSHGVEQRHCGEDGERWPCRTVLIARMRVAETALATIRNDIYLEQMTPNPNDPGAYVLGRRAERALFEAHEAAQNAGDAS